MLNFEYIAFVLIVIVGVLASIFDCRTMKIPNAISFSFMGVGIVWNALFNKESWWMNLIAFVIIFLFGSLRLMGLGDIKMLMGLTLIAGWYCTLLSILFSCVLFALIQMVFRFKQTWYTINNTLFLIKTGNVTEIKKSTVVSDKKPFFIYILFGYIISFFLIKSNLL